MRSLRPFLQLARISNLPTVWTNALVGCALGDHLDFERGAATCATASCLYIFGMALNDWFDAAIDVRRGTARPIAAGRISRGGALIFALVWLALAGLCALPLDRETMLWASGLAATIVAYDALHHRWAPSIVLMGACRSLVYVFAAGALSPETVFVASGVGAYVFVVTLLARSEHVDDRTRPRRMAPGIWVLVAALFAPAAVLRPDEATSWGMAAVFGFATILWIVRSAGFASSHPPRAVMGWLATMCLADAMYAALLDESALVLILVGCFALTLAAQRRILGS